MSRGQSQRRADFQKRALGRCKLKGKANNVIDIDSDRIPCFINVDAPEVAERTSPDASISGKLKTPVCSNVIWIDDDDGESGHCGSSLDGFEEGGNPDAHFTSSNKCQCSCNQGRKFSSKSSNCCTTSSSKIATLNHQRFSSSTSCENDDSDCDIMEDYFGNIRQQWEEASLRKKMFGNVPKGQSNFRKEVGPMGFNIDSQNNLDVDKTGKAPYPCSTNGNHENDYFDTSTCISEHAGVTSNKLDWENQHTDLEGSIHQGMHKKASVCNNQVIDGTNFKPLANTEVKMNYLLSASNGDDASDIQNHIIGNREMLKKTDAYKRAEEEEWASRHRELQSQAEEAQRLRKRRKAENLRLLETKRRQELRLEEVRKAKQKDEETLNLKEHLRSEVRRELDKLEVNCQDMASLLRGLGIEVRGGPCPLHSEILAAYKQAKLRFHPDRASRSDIRQQIEAEEKFKLVSHAKEKFML